MTPGKARPLARVVEQLVGYSAGALVVVLPALLLAVAVYRQ